MSQNFSKAKIYKITNDYNDDIYIGSTCDSLNKRFSEHKRACKKEASKDRPLYQLINEIGFERFRIDLIEEWEAKDKQEIRQKEGKYIRELGTLNKQIAGRTKEEYNEDNKEKLQEYTKQYCEQNKEILKEKKNEYCERNKEILKEKGKQYYENNKEVIAEKNKEKYQQNKETYNEKRKEKILCECGCEVRKDTLSRHQKSKKHLAFFQ